MEGGGGATAGVPGGWGLVWPGDGNPRRPSARSPELVVGRRRSAGRLWRSVPRICCSGAFGRGKVVLGRSVVRLEGGGVGDCRGSGWLGVGLAGRWESPPACYGRLTGAGPGKEKGIWGSHSGLSPAFAAVGALEGGRWFWGGVVVWLVGKRVMIMAVRAVREGGWGGLGWFGRAMGTIGIPGFPDPLVGPGMAFRAFGGAGNRVPRPPLAASVVALRIPRPFPLGARAPACSRLGGHRGGRCWGDGEVLREGGGGGRVGGFGPGFLGRDRGGLRSSLWLGGIREWGRRPPFPFPFLRRGRAGGPGERGWCRGCGRRR